MRSPTNVADRILRAIVPRAAGSARCAAVAPRCGRCWLDPTGRWFRTCCYVTGPCHEVCTDVEC
ncbi:hypothetical protein Afil01_46990 [Actinorhabdospora filicis]|uniref:Uncharacterized protein n=1 Tax=Actinorhabdospora filicis TaxID=1785913 RepID=A0A9W6SQ92_9ACTN|nr:hypothetical protein [Actinorhabdospora filicis]GLZ79892.1 hypothetical protein Afil01_46990 [Actinorhabdospora filicis]